MTSQDSFEHFKSHTGPPLFVAGFTLMTQILAVLGTTHDDVTWSLFGNAFSWTTVGFMVAWALGSMRVPGPEYKGPPSPSGYTPVYKANGVQFFGASLLAFVVVLFLSPQIAVRITMNFPQIIATCNIVAFMLCIHLYNKGKTSPEVEEKLEEQPMMFEFFRGMEVHPRLFEVDVKQLTNCRFGLMAWLLLNICFFVSSCVIQGFSLPLFITVVLQTIYLGKFYWWETGYFNTLDITLDRAGYYICWGCIVWVPCFYTFSAYYLSSRPPLINNNVAWLVLFFGLIVTVLNYWVDWEKEYFRKLGGRCHIWGKTASFIVAPYKTSSGASKKSQLLTSGFWGIARHLNYVFEILVAFSWSLPALGYGIWPFMYPIFLTVLLVHRVFRDEKKCKEKYGKAWDEYCTKVPYRMIPGVF
ncbi:UNVERIFIED_CONTAM: hypothetical protein GTU68_059375 [Idotea baltica]|nr:hypothetical protein [Idotea baltica]